MKIKMRRLLCGFLTAAMLACSSTAWASSVAPSADQITLDQNDTTAEFEVLLHADRAFAGLDFGLRPSQPDVTLAVREGSLNGHFIDTVKDGNLYFSYYSGNGNVFEPGQYTVGTITCTYSGKEERTVELLSADLSYFDGDVLRVEELDTRDFSFRLIRDGETPPPTPTPDPGGKPHAAAPDAPVLKDNPFSKDTKDAWGYHHSVRITWTAPDDNGSPITAYVIRQDGRVIGKVDGSARAYTASGLTNGKIYSYTVTAVNAGGEAESNAISAIPNSAGPDYSRNGGEGGGDGHGIDKYPLNAQQTNAAGQQVSPNLDEIWLQFTHNVSHSSSNPGIGRKNLEKVTIWKEGAKFPMDTDGYVLDTKIDFIHRQFLFFKLNEKLEPNTTYTIKIDHGIQANNGAITPDVQLLTFKTAGTGDAGDIPGQVEEETKTEIRPDGTKVETTTRTDGSVTIVETAKDGTVTITNVNKDGDKSVTVKKPDGSSVTDITMSNGAVSNTTVDKTGRPKAEVSIPETVIQEANKNGKPVMLPLPVLTVSGASAPSITVDTGAAKNTVICVPVANLSSGIVAYIVQPDGTRELVRKTSVAQNCVMVMISGKATIELEYNAKTFVDVASHWGADAVAFVSARELFQGTGPSIFSPDAPMTRAMLATVLWRLEDEPQSAAASSFPDVERGQWYASAIDWAAERKIVNGYGAIFAPNDPITRQQLTAMMYRYAGMLGLDTGSAKDLSGFRDGAIVADWASDAMKWAVSVGLICGKNNNMLDPAGTATRAEVATICQRMVNMMVQTLGITVTHGQ